MSVTPRRALIVIDVQNEYVTGRLRIEYPAIRHSLHNIALAMDGARAGGIPIVVVQNTAPNGAPIFDKGTAGWALHDTVQSRPFDHYIEKSLPSAFAGTDLADWIEKRGIDTLVVSGYMTHNCDDATIRHAFHAGLHVEFLSDASGSVPYANLAGAATAEEIHKVFSVVLQSRFAAVLTTQEWIHCVQSAQLPQRDSIFASNQRALKITQGLTAPTE
jgi:nicotinamidase-related amidase